MSRFNTQSNNSSLRSQVLTLAELRNELRVGRAWIIARLETLEAGVDWFTVEAANRIGKGGARSGGYEYRFCVSALDKLRQAGRPGTQLDPMQGNTVTEIAAIIRRQSAHVEA